MCHFQLSGRVSGRGGQAGAGGECFPECVWGRGSGFLTVPCAGAAAGEGRGLARDGEARREGQGHQQARLGSTSQVQASGRNALTVGAASAQRRVPLAPVPQFPHQ